MTTARDWLIEILKDDCSLHFRTAGKCADEILAAAPCAPESVRLELAAVLNPWRPIETAPRDETYVLMWGPPNNYGVGYFSEREKAWDWDNPNPGKPTLWQPLPSPSNEDGAT